MKLIDEKREIFGQMESQFVGIPQSEAQLNANREST